MARITSDLFDVTEFSHHCPEEFFIAFLKIIVSFAILSRINLTLTVIIFMFIPITAVSCTYYNLKVRDAFKQQRNHVGELNARIEDRLLGNRVVRAFGNGQPPGSHGKTGNIFCYCTEVVSREVFSRTYA